MLLGLAILVARPHRALQAGTLVPYAAGFGALVVFFEMLTGQLPVAAAWLVALVVATRRDHALMSGGDVRALALAALVAFGMAVSPPSRSNRSWRKPWPFRMPGRAFLASRALRRHARGNRQAPWRSAPFFRLWDAAYVLTYGSTRAGRVLVLGIGLACLLAAAAAWRDRRLDRNVDRLIVLTASLIPVAWVLVLPQHTVIHATFMVRILVGSIALAPLAVFWPVPAGRR